MEAIVPVAVETSQAHCGLIMPLAEFDNCSATHWDDVRKIISSAVETLRSPSFIVRMVSEGDETGIIHRRIIQNVYSDPIVVCDVSGRNPNVLFELGMRLAFDKPVVIVKDDQTPFMFDTGMIEHLQYPRDLRHGAIENFKAALAKKVSSTYAAATDNPESISFIQSFGPFKTVKLDSVEEPADKAILTMLGDMQSQIHRLAGSVAQMTSNAATNNQQELPRTPLGMIHEWVLEEWIKSGGVPDHVRAKLGLRFRELRGAMSRGAFDRSVEDAITALDAAGVGEPPRNYRSRGSS
ncbi:hypothetical protein ACFKHW_17150 [Bradyrhizobium lupini]|uniref:hypothetical protein n=1 Tax=Rhizobium lupini TaxID=136996 RepID=UPI00367354B5